MLRLVPLGQRLDLPHGNIKVVVGQGPGHGYELRQGLRAVRRFLGVAEVEEVAHRHAQRRREAFQGLEAGEADAAFEVADRIDGTLGLLRKLLLGETAVFAKGLDAEGDAGFEVHDPEFPPGSRH